MADNDKGPDAHRVAFEQQYDAFMEGRTRPSLLATGMGEVPSADEIAADVEAFLREVNDEGRPGLTYSDGWAGGAGWDCCETPRRWHSAWESLVPASLR